MSLQKNFCELNNLSFPADYFEDEVRDGFVVTSMMKRYWASQLKVLSEVAGVCERHGIKWFADCGTLIGAVRHEGYVPWDDDLDIGMLRSDWLKFFSLAEKELPENYKILTMTREDEYQEVIGRIVNSHAIDYGIGNLKEFFSCPYTVGIDIFPLDSLFDDEEKEADRKRRAGKVLQAISDVTEGNPDEHYMRKLIRDIEKENDVTLQRDDTLLRQLNLLAEKIYMECTDENTEKVALMPFYIPRGNHIYDRELFDSIVMLPFETTKINVPARYDEVLDLEYGDFMKVIKGGGMHDYPVYRDQEMILAKFMGHNPYRYTYDINALLQSVQRYTRKVISGAKPREKKKILFLPVKSKWWGTMEDLYLSAKADADNDVKVIPIPWYECDTLGNVGVMHEDVENFPKDLPVTYYGEYDFGSEVLDAIVVQVPYDGWSMAMTVPEFFYSDNLLSMTEELVYVPFFDAADPEGEDDKAEVAISYMVEQPVVINADRVVLKSEKMCKLYRSKLTSFSGEETRNYWENKVVLKDKLSWVKENADKNSEKAPEKSGDDKWTKLVGDVTGKKVIIYYISVSMLLKGRDKAIDKIKRALEIFGEAEGILCVVLPQEQIFTELKEIDPKLFSEFEALVDKALPEKKNCVYDDQGTALSNIELWDAFYGDRGSVPLKCVELGIPVMIENMDV